jgi:hypothetical protein
VSNPDNQVERDLTIAFQRVFGVPGNRSKEQEIVLAKLRKLAKPGVSLWMPGQDETALAFAQGRLRMWQEIHSRVEPQEPTLTDLLGRPAEQPGDNDHE